MNKKIRFCRQLAEWFLVSDWHYSTLLAVFIDVADELPGDADDLVSELLAEFDTKPELNPIVDYLMQSLRLGCWFYDDHGPRVVPVCLINSQLSRLSNDALPVLNTESDVANWLNVSIQELTWLAELYRLDPTSPSYFKHYHYSIAKKRNGSPRLIESPKSRLRAIQRKVYSEILDHAVIHDSAHGFLKGKGCKTHASQHSGKDILFTFDLSHYFHSIRWPNVYAIFSGLGYTNSVSKILTALTTHRCYMKDRCLGELDTDHRSLLRERHLPQGAPTSPSLSNAVLYFLDCRLSGLAASLNMKYSRYADDLAFSGDTGRDWRFLEPLVGSICLEQGFRLNHRKTRIMKSHQKQRLTGVVVNTKPNVDRKHYDRLKATLTNCLRHGLESQNRDNHPDFFAYLEGSIAHVGHLNSARGKTLKAMYDRVIATQG
ncbi:hypothetical protein A9Q99_04775 [Gammaproteobacteria bacterium 45_16_T64]|nr:hypothetical protein A9Q99_04775 [Gammaproteobacteria bacterium 45_16_T64]